MIARAPDRCWVCQAIGEAIKTTGLPPTHIAVQPTRLSLTEGVCEIHLEWIAAMLRGKTKPERGD